MRNKITVIGLLSAFLTLTSISWAQNDVKFGILGGINITNAEIKDGPLGFNQKTRLSFSGGVFAELVLNDISVLDLRAMYMQKGVKYEGSLATLTVLVDYLRIPALIKIRVSNSGVKPFIFAGPDLGIRLRAKVVEKAFGVEVEDEDLEDDIELLDFAFDLGGGIELPMSSVTFLVQALYSISWTNIVKESEEPGRPGSMRTRGFIILSGIRF